jgi:hypothetical protein
VRVEGALVDGARTAGAAAEGAVADGAAGEAEELILTAPLSWRSTTRGGLAAGEPGAGGFIMCSPAFWATSS